MSNKKTSPRHNILTQILFYASAFLILLLIAFYKELGGWIATVASIFRPVVLGLVIAYILNPLFRFLERRILSRLRPSALRRVLSLLFTYVLAFVCVGLILWLIIPQLITTVGSFIMNYQMHVDNLIAATNGTIDYINHTIKSFFKVGDILDHVDGTKFFAVLGEFLTDLQKTIDLSNLTDTASGLVSIIADLIFALFISIYLLSSKEKRYAQVIKLRRALFSDLINQRITKVCTSANALFGRFVEGRLLDSLIVGALIYVAILIFNIPYALLIASFIAVFNIIPILGFLIGFVPSALIVVLTDSDKFLPFLLIAFIIYQLDVNIISPRILGYNTGVSALCVIISICTMGGLFGIAGMIVAVPLFATVLDVFDSFIHRRLQLLRMPDDVENYYAPDPILDPIHTMKGGVGKAVLRLEKDILRINGLIDHGKADELKKRDRFTLTIYQYARKLRLLPTMPVDVLTQFAAEHAEREIVKESNQLLQKRRAEVKAQQTQTDAKQGGANA